MSEVLRGGELVVEVMYWPFPRALNVKVVGLCDVDVNWVLVWCC